MSDTGHKIDPHTNPVCLTYGDLVRRHMYAARDNGMGSDRQEKLYALIQALRSEYPDHAEAWDSLFDRPVPDIA